MPTVEVEVAYEPVARYNKYKLSIKQNIEYSNDVELDTNIKIMQTKVRKLVKEQIDLDLKSK